MNWYQLMLDIVKGFENVEICKNWIGPWLQWLFKWKGTKEHFWVSLRLYVFILICYIDITFERHTIVIVYCNSIFQTYFRAIHGRWGLSLWRESKLHGSSLQHKSIQGSALLHSFETDTFSALLMENPSHWICHPCWSDHSRGDFFKSLYNKKRWGGAEW